ncbi:MAG: hypothetical protein H7A51_05470 [Akkermansiaceae bacterium]|nr:hypothetical protein [Akkermansiaceae bacterium]
MTNTLVYIHCLAADHLQRLGNRDAVIQFIHALAANPETVGDYRQADPRGRMIEVKLLGRQAVLFFNDPFAGIVKILDIRNVEAL